MLRETTMRVEIAAQSYSFPADLFDITPNAWASWGWCIPHTGTGEEFAPLTQLREIEMPL
jgi:hypothetical protein